MKIEFKVGDIVRFTKGSFPFIVLLIDINKGEVCLSSNGPVGVKSLTLICAVEDRKDLEVEEVEDD